MLVAINQDMVGARQSMGGRVQYAARLPWSLPHPLEDVMATIRVRRVVANGRVYEVADLLRSNR